MKIAILKDKKVISVIDIQKYILDSVVRAHGGDSWIEVLKDEVDSDLANIRDGDLVLSERDESGVEKIIVHPKE